jgi:beta-mannosidase
MDLSGNWTLVSQDGEFSTNYAVPGDVHSALIAAGLIPHPYKGRKELGARWVADRGWVASREFTVNGIEPGQYYLDITYLDTVADISINGVQVLHAENCFRRYRPDITQALRVGDNTIEIMFHSNTAAANAKQAAQPFPIPYHAGNCPIPNGNMLRKPACHFGWDWNLAIVPFGIYGRIAVCRMKDLRIEHVTVQQKHGSESGAVTVDVDVTLRGRGETTLTVSLAGETKSRKASGSYGEVQQKFRFTVEEPKLWWPAGLGKQDLYDLVVTCEDQTVTRRVGLRTLSLLTQKDDAGNRFAFAVNGHEVFCKGANWIPADALPSAITEETVRKLLQSAADANMNMLRVWGGGYYEPDYFYEICDELGLLVWQDFMFSCNLYPSTPEFLAEVKEEVAYQVKRLQHHACLVLWCGDNELIGALTWFKESKDNRDRYLVNYDRLNRTVEEAMRAADPKGLWWPSSPSPGVLDFGDAWHDDSSGDMHFWSVWHEGKNFEHYYDVKPRFCSEFGFQSFPSLPVVRQFIESDEDLNISSAVMEHHQRNAGGNARIAETMFRYFRFPISFGGFAYLSQVQQGYAMRMAIEYWRSIKPHCMGALYWQLNDTWPVASWSGLEHGGGWKALHFMARRFFAPVTVCAFREPGSGDVVFMGINDTREPVEIELAVSYAVTDGTQEKVTETGKINVPADKPVELRRIVAANVRNHGVYVYEWQLGDGTAGRNHFAPVPYKTLWLLDPAIQGDIKDQDGVLNITLTASKLALYVMVETEVPGRFSDNYFDLYPNESYTLTFRPEDPAHLERARTTLAVRDLYISSHQRKS